MLSYSDGRLKNVFLHSFLKMNTYTKDIFLLYWE